MRGNGVLLGVHHVPRVGMDARIRGDFQVNLAGTGTGEQRSHTGGIGTGTRRCGGGHIWFQCGAGGIVWLRQPQTLEHLGIPHRVECAFSRWEGVIAVIAELQGLTYWHRNARSGGFKGSGVERASGQDQREQKKKPEHTTTVVQAFQFQKGVLHRLQGNTVAGGEGASRSEDRVNLAGGAKRLVELLVLRVQEVLDAE